MLQGKRFVSKKQQEAFNRSWRGKYLNNVQKHSFLLFGLPFFAVLFGATYYLSFFTALRYEQHDRRITALDEEQALSIGANKRKVDMKEEFYRLQKMDLDSWEQVRVKRLPGESENKWSKD